jgi:predicted secreted protein
MIFSIGMMVYVMIWVVVLFMVLPWGVRIPAKPELGHADSAPENPYIGLKFLITSVISGLFWVVAYLILS